MEFENEYFHSSIFDFIYNNIEEVLIAIKSQLSEVKYSKQFFKYNSAISQLQEIIKNYIKVPEFDLVIYSKLFHWIADIYIEISLNEIAMFYLKNSAEYLFGWYSEIKELNKDLVVPEIESYFYIDFDNLNKPDIVLKKIEAPYIDIAN